MGETKRPRAADSVAWPGLTEGLFCVFGPLGEVTASL